MRIRLDLVKIFIHNPWWKCEQPWDFFGKEGFNGKSGELYFSL